MKKALSMILAMTTVATMGVTAFAQETNTDKTGNSEKLILSFGEEKFDAMLLPGETYTFPLYVAEEGKTPVIATETHLKDKKFRAEVKTGKSALASFKVEEVDDGFALEVKTEAGWPTKQTDVEGSVKLVKKTNGQVVASADSEFTVGHARILEENLEAAKAEEYVYVDSSAPVISTEQFTKLDKYTEGGKVTFTNGTWKYEVRVSDQKALNLINNEKAIKEISTSYEDQNFKYVSFPAGPEFDFTGTLTIDISDEIEEFDGNFFMYRYYKGKLSKVDATLNKEDGTLSFNTKTLGRFVITDKELTDGTVVQEGFSPEAGTTETVTEETKPSVETPKQDSNNTNSTIDSSINVTTNNSANTSSDKANPNTGASDMVGLAAAAAIISLVGAGVLAMKKSK